MDGTYESAPSIGTFCCTRCKQAQFRALWDPIVGSFIVCKMCSLRYFRDGRSVPEIEELSAACENMTHHIAGLFQENARLKSRVLGLEIELADMKKLLMEVYYAPGMPGAREAALDFSKIMMSGK